MGVYTATEELATAVEDNLASKIDEVASDQGVSLDSSFTFYDRERAETFWQKSKAGAGVWMRSSRTGAASQKKRRWQVQGVIDYSYQGRDRSKVARQVELVTDAIMRVVDEVPQSSTNTTIAASEERFGSVAVTDMGEMIQEAAGDVSQHGPLAAAIRVDVPLEQRETLP